MNAPNRNGRVFWTAAAAVIALDVVSKILVVRYIGLDRVPHRVIGSVVRFTLAYNPGAAFSMSLGRYQRWLFGAFAAIALVIVWRLYRSWSLHRSTPGRDLARTLSLGLIWGGAAGNLIDRVVSARGVVDFIDIGVGDVRFWTFNVADSAVTVGAVLLALVLWRDDRDIARAGDPIETQSAK
ncbi:MAG: signal peptidase II [Gemmatimonadales bacterium]|jgi:signal peptidase II